MRLKRLLPYLKGLNDTQYKVYVIDAHFVMSNYKDYLNYKVYEIFKKKEDRNSVYISVYKDKKKLKEEGK